MHGSFPAPAAPVALRAPPAGAFKRLAIAATPAPGAKIARRECLECGEELPASAQPTAQFCCSGHRMAWNNRRRERGAELYDLWMMVRYDRGLAKLRGLWTLMCSLARGYRDADRHYRNGRRSWRRCSDALDSIPFAYGKSGDNR